LSNDDISKLSIRFRELVVERLKEARTTSFSREVLSILEKKGFLLYCVSASPIDELIEILEYKKIRRFFVKVYGGSTPKEENFELLSFNEKIDFSDMIYIGDSEIDLTSSKNKNISFIGYGNIIPKWGKGQHWIQNWKEIVNYY
jgi:phosphoglycolate phosphatase-like HAD superfamily hydrolase